MITGQCIRKFYSAQQSNKVIGNSVQKSKIKWLQNNSEP